MLFKYRLLCVRFIFIFGIGINVPLTTTAFDDLKQNKPNIIMIVADDLGFNDVPWHNKEVVAPNLQKLAEDGIILEQSYVQPICSPTRAALLSGIYPFATGRQHSVIWPLVPTGLTLAASVMPQFLKPLGYETHAVGKWHLGFCKWEYTPTERGFDNFRGYYTGSEDYYTHLRTYHGSKMRNNENQEDDTISSEVNSANEISQALNSTDTLPTGYDFRNNRDPYFEASGTYSTYEFATHLEEVLHSSDSKTPKFIYMAFQSVHSPLEVPKNYTIPYMHIKDKNRRTYLGMVTAMDEAVGRIVAALKETDHFNNSLIVFTTDNGGPTITGGNNWPLRGNKTTLWEGGTRGAAFVHSLLLPNPGTVSNNLIHVTDWMATFITLAGGTPPNGTDSISQWEALSGMAKSPRKEIVYNIDTKNSKLSAGIRVGDYKLLVGDPGAGEWTPPPELEIMKPQIYSASPFNFMPSNFSIETNRWSFSDHINFIRKVKRKCDHLQCLQPVLKAYRAVKNRKDKYVWSKVLKILKKHSDSLRKWSTKTGKTTYGRKEHNSVDSTTFNHNKLTQKEKELKLLNQTIDNFDAIEDIIELRLPFRLYDLKDDPEERKNLAAQKPGLVITLMRRLLSYKDRWVPPDEPADDPRGKPEYWDGVWSPGWC